MTHYLALISAIIIALRFDRYLTTLLKTYRTKPPFAIYFKWTRTRRGFYMDELWEEDFFKGIQLIKWKWRENGAAGSYWINWAISKKTIKHEAYQPNP